MFNNINETFIKGCFEIKTNTVEDDRGSFTKIFNSEEFKKKKFNNNFVEQYYTTSLPNVVRGFHFQIPPYSHAKLIYCVYGEVLDVTVDIRVGSPTYGKFYSTILSAKKSNMIYLNEGLAHGFCTGKKKAILVYQQTTSYNKENDKGILWNSVGVEWGIKNPIISNRDANFPTLNGFKSPFLYSKEKQT